MPVMDGYEALASLKEVPETQAIRVLMLSALDLPFQQNWPTTWAPLAMWLNQLGLTR